MAFDSHSRSPVGSSRGVEPIWQNFRPDAPGNSEIQKEGGDYDQQFQPAIEGTSSSSLNLLDRCISADLCPACSRATGSPALIQRIQLDGPKPQWSPG